MDISYPSPHCDCSPNGAHYWVEVFWGKSIWRCRYCLAAKWLPADICSAEAFKSSIYLHGRERAYRLAIGRKPNTRRMVILLQLLALEEKSPTKGGHRRKKRSTYDLLKNKKVLQLGEFA